jgi:hypothetical protein
MGDPAARRVPTKVSTCPGSGFATRVVAGTLNPLDNTILVDVAAAASRAARAVGAIPSARSRPSRRTSQCHSSPTRNTNRSQAPRAALERK